MYLVFLYLFYIHYDYQKNPNEKDQGIIKMYPNENNYNIKEIEDIDNEINFEENE